jgi:hypothetical protein
MSILTSYTAFLPMTANKDRRTEVSLGEKCIYYFK